MSEPLSAKDAEILRQVNFVVDELYKKNFEWLKGLVLASQIQDQYRHDFITSIWTRLMGLFIGNAANAYKISILESFYKTMHELKILLDLKDSDLQ